MKLKTIGCVALMAVSTAALAQTTTRSRHHSTMNNMAAMNTMSDPSMPMNTSDEPMMNDMSSPNGSMTPNSTMQPR